MRIQILFSALFVVAQPALAQSGLSVSASEIVSAVEASDADRLSDVVGGRLSYAGNLFGPVGDEVEPEFILEKLSACSVASAAEPFEKVGSNTVVDFPRIQWICPETTNENSCFDDGYYGQMQLSNGVAFFSLRSNTPRNWERCPIDKGPQLILTPRAPEEQ